MRKLQAAGPHLDEGIDSVNTCCYCPWLGHEKEINSIIWTLNNRAKAICPLNSNAEAICSLNSTAKAKVCIDQKTAYDILNIGQILRLNGRQDFGV